MEKLFIQPPNHDFVWWSLANVQFDTLPKRDGLNVSVTNVMLHDLENTLENYAAAFFWSLAYLRNSPTIQSVDVVGPELVSELQTVAGLILSILLLILLPLLVGLGPKAAKWDQEAELDTLGVLEILWLAGGADAVAAVEKPSSRHLRTAGILRTNGWTEIGNSKSKDSTPGASSSLVFELPYLFQIKLALISKHGVRHTASRYATRHHGLRHSGFDSPYLRALEAPLLLNPLIYCVLPRTLVIAIYAALKYPDTRDESPVEEHGKPDSTSGDRPIAKKWASNCKPRAAQRERLGKTGQKLKSDQLRLVAHSFMTSGIATHALQSSRWTRNRFPYPTRGSPNANPQISQNVRQIHVCAKSTSTVGTRIQRKNTLSREARARAYSAWRTQLPHIVTEFLVADNTVGGEQVRYRGCTGKAHRIQYVARRRKMPALKMIVEDDVGDIWTRESDSRGGSERRAPSYDVNDGRMSCHVERGNAPKPETRRAGGAIRHVIVEWRAHGESMEERLTGGIHPWRMTTWIARLLGRRSRATPPEGSARVPFAVKARWGTRHALPRERAPTREALRYRDRRTYGQLVDWHGSNVSSARMPSRAGPGLGQAEPSPTQGFGGLRARA
ncbi:hypothetical protein C8R44DRAFT_929289 [Mycena epipterygia]|nr:hypothetical protein C8R44DRAFT_929289 [Mycena epipterygia]